MALLEPNYSEKWVENLGAENLRKCPVEHIPVPVGSYKYLTVAFLVKPLFSGNTVMTNDQTTFLKRLVIPPGQFR